MAPSAAGLGTVTTVAAEAGASAVVGAGGGASAPKGVNRRTLG